MNKKLRLTCLLSIAGITAFCQPGKVTWGPGLDLTKYTQLDRIIGSDASGIYSLFSEYRGTVFYGSKYLMLAKIDKDLRLNLFREIKPAAEKEVTLSLEDVQFTNKHLTLYSSFYNNEQGKNYAFANSIDGNGNVDKFNVPVDEISADKKRNSGMFEFVQSPDSSKTLVYHIEPFEKKQDVKISYKVIDSDRKLIFSKELVLPYKNEYFESRSYTVTNNGNVYMLAKIFSEERTRNLPNYKFVMLSYSHKDDKLNTFDVSLGEKFITSISFKSDKLDKSIVCAGFYSDDKDMNSVGQFYLRINSTTSELIGKGLKTFGNELLMKVNPGSKKPVGIPNLKLNDILIKDDGNMVLAAEKYYSEVVTSGGYNGGPTYTTTVYHHEDVFVINMAPDASLNWVSWIAKQQITSGSDYFSSYLLVNDGDNIHIIFNDNKLNMEPDPKKVFAMMDSRISVAVMISIDKDGNSEKNLLYGGHENDYVMVPKRAFQKSPKEIYIYGIKLKEKEYSFGRINLN